jgi:hypothetical protein
MYCISVIDLAFQTSAVGNSLTETILREDIRGADQAGSW